MPIYMKVEGIDSIGRVAASAAPSVSEIVVTKTFDLSSEPLFDQTAPDNINFDVFDGTSMGINADVDSDGAIAGIVLSASTDNNRLDTDDGVNLYDGSVRLIGTSDAFAASDFFLI